ncbi:succinylglutamate-semialdehyde dehydrogenase [Allohahella marinimesophila]|uniref:Succinylglutamate-semialdehyde dehydrogenase n=1 Tax=Allohahella marinimesophila TaxID=1054972 RepID=A0ABP7P3F8_9GAMM
MTSQADDTSAPDGAQAGQQVDSAVLRAKEALKAWAGQSFDARADICRRFANWLGDNIEEAAHAIGRETGKPLWESRTEVQAMIGKVDISIRAYHERCPEKSTDTPAGTSVLRHRPHGVLAVFGPYNFPGHLPNGHIVPALLAGNTVVFKPSELTPRFGDFMHRGWIAAGLPDGILNIVHGGPDIGKALAAHHGINGLLFTGSSSTGAIIHEQYGAHPGKILALEMGGNNALILASPFPEAAAVMMTLQSAFLSAGQRCTCSRRLIVEKGPEGDRFLQALIKATEGISIGAYDQEPQPFMGRLISERAADQVLAAQAELVSLGGTLLLESTHIHDDKAFLSPGIVDVTDIKDLPDREVFGPLLQVQRYEHFDEALQLANATEFGLAGGIITNDRTRYEAAFDASHVGIFNWNKPLTGASSGAPFGGVGASGNHRPSAYYAADYCAYPVASLVDEQARLPASAPVGLVLPGAG